MKGGENMKSYGGRATINRVKQECERFVAENLDSIKYDLFCEIVQDDFRQAEAVLLYAMSMHGYGTARLQRMHEWFKAAVDMPDIIGKTPHCLDCQKLLTEKHGIDFGEITVRYESREQFEKR